MGDAQAGESPGAKPTSTFEMVNVPRHANSSNRGSVFGGPMPSHREETEIILRLEETGRGLRAQPTEKRTCALTTATAGSNMMTFTGASLHKTCSGQPTAARCT